MRYLPALNTQSRPIALAALMLALSVPCAAATTMDGFVTKVASPTDFQLSALHVVVGRTTQCFTEELESNIEPLSKTHFAFVYQWYFGLRDQPYPKSKTSVPCSKMVLTTGSHVRVVGDTSDPGQPFLTTQVTDYNVAIRQDFGMGNPSYEWDGGALLEEQPQVKQTTKGWSGTIWLDG